MPTTDGSTARDRVYEFVTRRFNDYLQRHRLPKQQNNDLVALRNEIVHFYRTVVAEYRTKKTYGVDIDYINSGIDRIDLSQASNPYLLRGTIPIERPPGATNEEIAELEAAIRQILFRLGQSEPGYQIDPIEDVINAVRKTFTLPNEGLPFTSGLYDRTPHGYPQYFQNTPCEICMENRAADECHIIPAAFGGTRSPRNILYLCPTHHRLFDHCMLTEKEWSEIDFGKKGRLSSNYAFYVLLPKLKVFWSRLEQKQNKKMSVYDTSLSTADRSHLEQDISSTILEAIRSSPGCTVSSICAQVDIDASRIRAALRALKKFDLLVERRIKGKPVYFEASQNTASI